MIVADMMNIRIHKHGMEPPALVLLAIAALLGALILLVVARSFAATADARRIVARMTASPLADPSAAMDRQTKSGVDELKKKHLFAPRAERKNPVTEVAGILGDAALINGRWYKQGDKVGDARIVAIEATKVTVAWDGQEKEFLPIDSSGSGGGAGSDRAPTRGGPPTPGAAPPRAVRGPAAESPGRPPSISPEQLNSLRERMVNMSPEERQRYQQQMREQLSSRAR